MYVDNSHVVFVIGGLAVAIPGMLKGLVHAYKKFGVTDWSSLVQPAITLAKNGFEVHKTLATAIKKSSEDIKMYPSLR